MRSLLNSILSRPTAPFRESWVMAAILQECNILGIPTWADSVGNLWLGARNKSDVKSATLAFVAHTDHPGFIIDGFTVAKGHVIAHARWLGGGPTLEKALKGHGVKVFSHVHGLQVFDGTIKSITAGSARAIKGAEISVHVPKEFLGLFKPAGFKSLGPWGACLWFAQGGLSFQGDRLRTKAADDLVGVCALIEAYHKAGCPKGVVALLSRAEESGFHGTIDVLEKKLLSSERTTIVSVETSSERPGALRGGGPVVRLGDRSSVFHPAATRWVQNHALTLAGKNPWGVAHPKTGFIYQRQVMDGGSCEGSAFNAYGFIVAAVSVPLGGYHNVGPKLEPVVEEVSLSDVTHTATLLSALMKDAKAATPKILGKAESFAAFKKDIVKNYRQSRKWF